MAASTTFYPFPRLPRELQLLIIEHAFEDFVETRNHTVTMKLGLKDSGMELIIPPLPSIFNVNRLFRFESTRVAGKTMIPAVGPPNGAISDLKYTRILFDPDSDVLELIPPKSRWLPVIWPGTRPRVYPCNFGKYLSPQFLARVRFLHFRVPKDYLGGAYLYAPPTLEWFSQSTEPLEIWDWTNDDLGLNANWDQIEILLRDKAGNIAGRSRSGFGREGAAPRGYTSAWTLNWAH